MQGFHGWMRSFDIVFAAYCCGTFVPASVLCNFPYCFTIKVSRFFKCWLLNVVNVVYCYVLDNLIGLFLRKSNQNIRKSTLRYVNDAMSSSCVQLLVAYDSLKMDFYLFSCEFFFLQFFILTRGWKLALVQYRFSLSFVQFHSSHHISSL